MIKAHLSSANVDKPVMVKKFKVTAKFNNLWAIEQLIAKVDADKRLNYEVKDNWTVYVYGDNGVIGLLDEAKKVVSSSFGYVDNVDVT